MTRLQFAQPNNKRWLNGVEDPHRESSLVRGHRADGSVTKLHGTDELSGENLLPGFRCKVSDLFVVEEDETSAE